MEWDEIFVLLAVGAIAPYVAEAASGWIGKIGPAITRKNGANAPS